MTILGALDVGRRSKYLYQLEAADLAVATRTAQAPTFARADASPCAQLVDSNGIYSPVFANVPRIIGVDTDFDGVSDSSALLMEPSAKNIALQSSAFATSPWSSTGTTPTNAVGTYAGLSFCRFANANTSATSQTLAGSTFTGNGVKSGCLALKYDGQTGGTFHSLRDTTASADRLVIHATWGSNGVPSVVASPGAIVDVVPIGGGVYLVLFQTGSVTATNAHSVFANNGSAFGGTATSVLASAMMLSDTISPTSPIVTTSGAVARAADSLSYAFAPPIQPLTVYVKGVVTSVDFSGDPYFIDIGTSGGISPHLFLYQNATAGRVGILNRQSGGDVTAVVNPGHGIGDVIEAMGILNADGSVIAMGCKNGGSVLTSSASAANAMGSTWSSQTLGVGRATTGAGNFAYLSIRVAAGVQTIQAMRSTS